MAYFNQIDYTDFLTDYSLKSGVLATEENMNASTIRLKKELNNLYSMVGILNGNDIIPWRDVEPYITGELVQNSGYDDKYYRARKNSTNKRPDLFSDSWTEIVGADITEIGDFTQYLNITNNYPYEPINPYNPSTKKYVDDTVLDYMLIDNLSGDWDYFIRRGTYYAPAGLDNAPNAIDTFSVVILGNESMYTQMANSIGTDEIYYRSYNGSWSAWNRIPSTLNDNTYAGINNFSTTNTVIANIDTANITNLNGTNTTLDNLAVMHDTVINGNLIINGTTTTVNSTEMSVDDKNLTLGDITSPTETSANGGGITLKGTIDKTILYNMISDTWMFNTDLTATNFHGNADTASKWKTPRTLTLSGDVAGSVSIDGSANVNLSVSVFDNSHTHNDLYYTKALSDSMYLRKDQSGTLTGDLSIVGNLTVSGDILGTANKAKYADLAEVYTCEKEIEVGTILTIPTDDAYQVSECSQYDVPFGVVSHKPGFVLNAEAEGVEVALVGQTPVRVIGDIEKGDPITIYDVGVGIKCTFDTPKHLIVGRALETNKNTSEKLINVAVSI